MDGRARITDGPAEGTSYSVLGVRGSASGGFYGRPGVGDRGAGCPGGSKSFRPHVAFPDDPFVVLLDQQGTEEAGDGVAVREDTHDIGATTDLFVRPFLRVIGTDLRPMLDGEGAEGQDVVGGVEDI